MTHPLAALIAGVKVKPLEWDAPVRYGAKLEHMTTCRTYKVVEWEDASGHVLWFGQAGEPIRIDADGAAVGADVLKAAAQADYEARILAALEAAPVPDLVEAGKVAERADTYEVWVDGKSCNMGRTIRSLLARIAAQEAETQKVRRFLKISRDEGREALERAEAAEAKVEAVIRIAASLFPGGYDNNSALICAAIAESKK